NFNYDSAASDFVYVYARPVLDSELANDPAYTAPDRPINTDAESVPGRAYSGDIVYIKEVRGDWLKIEWADGDGWIYNPADKPVAVHIATKSASLKDGLSTAQTFGRAYPDDAAYQGTGVTPQPHLPLEYILRAGVEYPIADMNVVSDYYSSSAKKEIIGTNKYYAIYLGHHFVFVNADDVKVKNNPLPKIAPQPPSYSDFGLDTQFLIVFGSLLLIAGVILFIRQRKLKR
ncbi:MAG: hypothetical protein LBB07_00795, partial [Bifidobacteriaceae bacterium]|nr:hypothetical protein [Bifidobacteriaceae bacterium]